MLYYIFKNNEEGPIYTCGLVPEDKIQEESKTRAFKIVESLPEPLQTPNPYRLKYNEDEDLLYGEELTEEEIQEL